MLLVLALCAPVRAQHADVFVYQSEGKLITTRDGATQRVFSNLFDFFGHPFGNTSLPKAFVGDDPGFQTNDSPIAGASTLPLDEILSADFLPFQLPNGSAGNVLHWDFDSGDVDFAQMPSGHFFNVTDVSGDDSFFLTGSADSLNGVLLGIVSNSGDIHEHISWRLDDGDSNSATDPSNGVYLMMMQLHMNGIESSDPFAVMLNSTDISIADQNAAIDWVENNFDSINILGDSLVGDFDNDGSLEIDDIDQLVAVVAGQTGDLQFDLNGDGMLTLADVNEWRAIAGAANLPSMNPYLAGDATLDGVVDASDFNRWNGSKFTSTAAWSAGDFNADGVVDASDFNVWNSQKFQTSDQAMAVPEPGHLCFVYIFFSFVLFVRGLR